MIKITRPEKVPASLQDKRKAKFFVELQHFYQSPVQSRRQDKLEINLTPVIQCRNEILKAFHRKCAFCESGIGTVSLGDVLHFRPITGAKGFKEFSEDHYWWLIYEWRNLYLVCEHCGRFKQSWFPVEGRRSPIEALYEEVLKENALLVDPCNDEPSEHITFDERGNAFPFSKKGEVTINIFKLNRKELVEQRFENIRFFSLFVQGLAETKSVSLKKKKELKTIYEVLMDDTTIRFAGAIRSELLRLSRNKEIIAMVLRFRPPGLKSKFLDDLKNGARQLTVSKGSALDPIAGSGKFKLTNVAGRLIGSPPKRKQLTKTQKQDIEKLFLKRIEIKNFKAIKGLVLNFPEAVSDDKKVQTNEPWMLLLGENGVGKSSMLQAIALTLMGRRYLRSLKIKPAKILNRKGKQGYVRIFHYGSEEPYEIRFDSKRIEASHENAPTFLLGYGSTRLSLIPGLEGEPIFRNVKVKNLFYPESALADANKWIVALYRRSRTNKDQKILFDWVGRAIKDLLLLQSREKLVVENGRVLIRYTASNKADLEQLSDGYKSVITLAVDIMHGLIKDKTTIETAQGIVLIDEIGTHLHPRWKMQVVKRLRNVFPHVQFIVTTHDPLCLRGLRKGEIAVFTKSATRQVQVLTDLPDPSGMNAEQLLGSQFFGLNSTYDWEDEEKFNTYYYLLSRKSLTGTEQKRKKELQAFVDAKQNVGNSLFDQTLHQVINQKIAETKFVKPKSVIRLKDETMQKIKTIWGNR
jgi:hypothetical protein